MATVHTFSIQQDTANGTVDLDQLEAEVRRAFALDQDPSQSLTEVTIHTTQDLNAEQTDQLTAIVNNHQGLTAESNIQVVSLAPRVGSKVQKYSIDFAKKETWLPSAQKRSNVQLTPDADDRSLFWMSPTCEDMPIVNVRQGRIVFEERYRPEYNVVIRDANGNVLTEHSVDSVWTGRNFKKWHSGDGQVGVDYGRGRVVLRADVPTPLFADFYEVTTSLFDLTPDEGKTLILTGAELQFSTDCSYRDDWVFEIRGKVGMDPRLHLLWDEYGASEAAILNSPLAPFYVMNGNNRFPAGVSLPLQRNTYRTVMDIVSEANRAYPLIYKTTNPHPSWRDVLVDLQVFRWDYEEQAAIPLFSKWGNDVQLWFANHKAIEGWRALATFYAVSVDEE